MLLILLSCKFQSHISFCSQAWLNQKGKDVDQCQMEYIVLLTRYDEEFREIIQQVVTGVLKNIRMEDNNMKPGGIMSKSVPRPKPEDRTEYLSSLSTE